MDTPPDSVAMSLQLAALQGRVNAGDFRHEDQGKVTTSPAGTLLVQNASAQRLTDGTFRVAIVLARDEGGWNNIPATDGKRYPVRDANGQPIYLPTELPPERDDWKYQVVDVVRNRNFFVRVDGLEADAPVVVTLPAEAKG